MVTVLFIDNLILNTQGGRVVFFFLKVLSVKKLGNGSFFNLQYIFLRVLYGNGLTVMLLTLGGSAGLWGADFWGSGGLYCFLLLSPSSRAGS